MATTYQVIDNQTQQVVYTTDNRKRAYNKADRLDRNYGAIRYIVKPIWDEDDHAMQTLRDFLASN